MASSEKQMIPLDAIPGENKDVPEQLPSKEDLVDVKFPSRPRRKVVIIAGVIAVLVVITIAASLIGKYVPEHLNNAEDKSEKGSKGKGTGGPEESIPPSLAVQSSTPGPAETKPSGKPTIHQDQTRSPPEVKPSVKTTSSDVIKQGYTSSLPKVTSLTSATSSMSTASIVSSVSSTFSASSIVDVAVIANLVPNTESKWTRWSSWSDCTKTCGTGTRQRTRKCIAINQRAVFAPISCAGKAKQVKSCAEWSCPDCSKNCTIGTLNAACDACTCDHHLLTGRIWTVDDVPLSEVNISFANTPYNTLTQTNVSGHFSTLGVCANGQQEMLVTKDGFVPVKLKSIVLTATTATITAKLEDAVAPFITVHPKSKMRMPGQSVTFCCNGEGNPPPEIEWFKDNNIIDKDLYNYDNVLEIPDVVSLNGSFRCRVVNQFGSEFSIAAQLTVLEKSVDSCSSIPSSKNETLPSGCTVNGTNATTVDVGECEPVTCIIGNFSFNSSCIDPPLCCGPISFKSVFVHCGALMSFDLSIVEQCGCGKCSESQTVIEGTAVGKAVNAAKSVDVFFAGKSVDRTDKTGKFYFSVPKETKRAIVTFKDQINKIFQEEDKIFTLNEGQMAVYKVTLREKPSPINFNASEPLDVPLGGASDSFADLEIPENALLTEDGSVFSGNAKCSVSVTDPRNQSDILSAPGDFSSTSEDGEEQMLETFGMMKLNLEDDNGRPLTMSKPMKVYLDPEKLNITLPEGNASVVKLYWLDRKTGRWREAGDFSPEDGNQRRRKRSNRIFLAGTVTPSLTGKTLNFDTPTERVALRVTIDSPEDKDKLKGVVVRVIRKEGGEYKEYTERTTGTNGVVCISIWKGNFCYVQAEKNNKYYDPVDPPSRFDHFDANIKPYKGNTLTVNSLTFWSRLPKDGDKRGPTYHIDRQKELEMCHGDPDPIKTDRQQFSFKPPPNDVNREYSLLDPSLITNGVTCFIKVTVLQNQVPFMAVSYKKDDYTNNGKQGLHLRMPKEVNKNTPPTHVACLQIKCPPDDNNPTVLLVTPMGTSGTCIHKHTDPFLSSVQITSTQCTSLTLPTLSPAGGQEKWLCMTYGLRSSQLPYFRGSTRDDAEKFCMAGKFDLGKEPNKDGYTLKYDCRSNDDSFKSIIKLPAWPSNGKKCYVKVLVTGRRSVFSAASFSTNINQIGLFGYSTDITRPTMNDPTKSAACLEFKCNRDRGDTTYIVIGPTSAGCRFRSAGYDITLNTNQCGGKTFPPHKREERALCLSGRVYSNVIGNLYETLQNTPSGTEENCCRLGRHALFQGCLSSRLPLMYSSGYTLHYTCT